MSPAPQRRPRSATAPYLPIPVQVSLVSMRGSLLGATDVETGRVYVRADATAAEVGTAILDGVRQVAAAWGPQETGPAGRVLPFPRRSAEQEGDARGLG